MNDPKNDDDDTLDGVDLHAWHLPPPAPVDRASLLMRALAPATAPARRPRLRWLIAGIVLANAAVATLIVILLARPQPTRVVTVRPAGGSSVEAQVAELLQRLQQDQHDLEGKVDEIRRQRALVQQLSQKLLQCEERGPKPPGPTPDEPCDEVSCVLTNYEGGCCTKYKKAVLPPRPPAPGLPDALDREMISNGVATVKEGIAACGNGAKGVVKLHVRVGANGLVRSAEVAATPDPALGGCVSTIMKRAVFQRTGNGGSFSYPFAF